jgi:CBS domain-containing protein
MKKAEANGMKKIVPDVIDSQNLMLVHATMTVREAAKLMATHKTGAVMVGEGTTLHGIFTERDLMMKVVALGRDPETLPVADVMTPRPDTLRPDDNARTALKRMNDKGYRHLPVVDVDRVIGIVSSGDIQAAVLSELEDDLEDQDLSLFR